MRCLALLSLVFASGFGIRCYTRGLIGGSPRRRQSESVKEEEPLLLFCADNQICMISGNTGNPFAAQACVELLPGYPPENCRDDGRDGAFTCWCSYDSCNESKEKIEGHIAIVSTSSNRLNKTANVHSSTTKPPWSVSKTSSSTTLASTKSTSETTKASKPPKSAKTTKSTTQASSTKKAPQTNRTPPSSNSLDGPRIEPLDPPELLEPSKLQSRSHGLALKSKAALVYMLLICFNVLST